MKKILVLSILSVAIVFFSCNKKFNNTALSEQYLDTNEPDFGNKTSNPALNSQMNLGRVLFYDKSLSANNSISCASCHKQAYAFADNVALSNGFENIKTKRNSIAIQNLNSSIMNFGSNFLFWDGRENSLESLISKPIANHIEMGIDDEAKLITKLNSLPYYKDLTQKALQKDELTMNDVRNSMALFLMNITSHGSKFDLNQMSQTGLNPSFSALEKKGQFLFQNTYQCTNCHQPSPFGNFYSEVSFMNIGLDVNNTDKGRMNVTNDATNEGQFKIPDLHNVAVTAPYMHDGRFNTLEDVLEHYSHNIKQNANLDTRLRNTDGSPKSFNISDDDKKAIIAFLNTMTDYSTIANPNFSNPFKSK